MDTLTQSQKKRLAILNAAKEIFLNQGFRATSMDDIAQTAQVSKKTIYHHFANKSVLFRYMLQAHWHETFDNQPVIFDLDKPLTTNLQRFATAFLKFLYHQNTIDLFRILITESKQFPTLSRDILINDKAPYTKALIDYLQQQNKAGKLKFKSAERAAAFLMGPLKEDHFWPMMLGFVKTNKPKNQKALIEDTIAMFINFFHLK